jgi:DNA-binding response OmpR family regulator
MNDLKSENTILFVDDEKVVLHVGTLMINKLGYEVLQAMNGKEANRVFKDNKDDIRLVVLDTNLPDELGIETCRSLKAIRPDVKVLHTSGWGKIQEDDVLQCGCNQLLPKPFKLKELSDKLEELLNNTYN